MASATTLTPINTSGTPLPGLVDAPTKCKPSTTGEIELFDASSNGRAESGELKQTVRQAEDGAVLNVELFAPLLSGW
jgi:hypothetical protein